MPKAELHLHIEGSLEPDLMMQLARRNNITLPFRTVEEIRAAYDFNCLQDFLDIYYQGMSVLQTVDDFYDLTFAYLERVAAQNVIHTEIFFDPQGHTDRGVSFETVITGISKALEQGKARFGISSRLIMCFLRHLPEESAFETLQAAEPFMDQIYGVGLDSSENGNPPSKFERVFARSREMGLACVAHAGEEGPPEYVSEALDLLKVDRIDHGNRLMEDSDLIDRVAKSGIALTVCPLSNQRLKVVENLADHPLRKMLEAGLTATVNSDDPSYFGGYMSENFIAVQKSLDLSFDEIKQLGRNGFAGSFMSDGDKQATLERFEHFSQNFS